MVYPNIEAERARRGMTKACLASSLGVSPDTVKNWQSGRTAIPASKIVALADLFGVSTDYLIGRTDSPTPLLRDLPETAGAECGA